jgi:hypothetical protein
LELPDGLRDIGDSDMDPEEMDISDHCENFDIEDRSGIRNFQDTTPNLRHFEVAEAKHYKQYQPQTFKEYDH